MGQGSGVGHLNKCVLITLGIYRSVCVRVLQWVQRCAGTLVSEPSSVFTPNLLSWGMEHRAGSGGYVRPPSVTPPAAAAHLGPL